MWVQWQIVKSAEGGFPPGIMGYQALWLPASQCDLISSSHLKFYYHIIRSLPRLSHC